KSLFKVLPNLDARGYSHGFTATGKKKSVAIQCSTHGWDDKKNEFYEIQNGPECSIVVGTAYDINNDEEDHSKWIADRAPQSVKKDAKSGTKEVKKAKKK
ncbi:MAG: hypothetical protein J7501_14740, partial [Bdellovibrio sp.]|nr:hypothetical protein [Bdellovibrio sp.]